MKTDSFDSAPHYHFNSLDSTNNYASKLAKLPETSNGTAISADFQSEGRGQRGTTWEAQPQQGFLVSFIIYPPLRANEIFYLSKFIAICLMQTLNKIGLNDVQIKWPNDLLVEGKKIAGILIENSWGESELQHSVVGIGLNVQPSQTEAFQSTSLAEHLPTLPSLTNYVRQFQEVLQENWNWLTAKNFALIDQHYHAQLYRLGVSSRFLTSTNAELIGEIQGVNPDGALHITDNLGQNHLFYLKEIKFA